MGRAVFMAEAEDVTAPWEDGTWLTGRFEGHLEGGTRVLETFEDLPIEAALAWGRARAEEVYVRLGHDLFSAGARNPDGAPSWPPADLPPLIRRRHPDDRWRDRTGEDPPIPWRVEILLMPPRGYERTLDGLRAHRDAWAAEAARVADAAGATFSAEPLDTFIADLAAAVRRAACGGEAGWMSYGGINFFLELQVEAPTAERAHEAALTRLTLPAGWRAEPSPSPPL